MIVCPSLASSFKVSNNSTVSCGVNTAVGSSNIKIFAPWLKAFNISNFCFAPTDKSIALAFGSKDILYFSPSSIHNCLAFLLSTVNNGPTGILLNIKFSVTVIEGTNMKCW